MLTFSRRRLVSLSSWILCAASLHTQTGNHGGSRGKNARSIVIYEHRPELYMTMPSLVTSRLESGVQDFIPVERIHVARCTSPY